jgi:ABC-type multidrug transport system ATPase subunit
MIVLENLGKVYGATPAVDAVSLSIERGTIFGLLGANGAGKTTTIRMLCGLTKPTHGRAAISGVDVWKGRYRARQHFGYMAQKFSLYTDLTVAENLGFFGGACGVPRARLAARISELLAQTDLAAKADAPAGSLSGGMKQRLSLACALVHDPAVLFLDEPTSGLDPVHRQELWSLLYRLSHEGKTLLVTTHYMDEAERCTEVGFLHCGKLLARDHPDRIKQRYRSDLLEVQVEPQMPALLALDHTPGILGASLRSGWIRLYAADPQALLESWQRAWPFPDLQWTNHRWASPDMEDVFRAYSQGFDGLLTKGAAGA